MLQTPDNSYKEIRTVLRGEANDVLVCRSMSGRLGYRTVIILKDRALHARLLEAFSGSAPDPSAEGLTVLTAIDSRLALIFPYSGENRLFFFEPLYCRNFPDRLNVAKNLLAELISTPLPPELLFFLLEDRNLNLRRDGRVYFNYFMDFSLLPEELDMGLIVGKAAEIIARLLSNGKKTVSQEAKLFVMKVRRGSFTSLGAIYADLKNISPDAETDASLPVKIKRSYASRKKFIASAVRTGLLALLIGASLLYSISEIRSRSAVAAQSMAEAKPAYRGMEKIGTLKLIEDYAKQENSDETD